MSEKNWKLRLDHILECIHKIERYLDGISKEQFYENEVLMDAIERNFEIIGEASKHIPNDIKSKNQEVDWQNIYGMRNILAHGYDIISPDILWDTAQEELPPLKEVISKIKNTDE